MSVLPTNPNLESHKTYQELLDKIKEAAIKYTEDTYCSDGENEFGYFAHECIDLCKKIDEENDTPFFGKVTTVDRTGGMDRGSDWSKVYHFEDHNVYMRVKGYYYSYDGTSFDGGWDNVTEVEPTEKTITIYTQK